MNSDFPKLVEWIEAENTLLKSFSQIDRFNWGDRYFFDKGPDHGKFNFIRFLDNNINESEFKEIVAAQEKYFKERSKSLHIKIPSSVFNELPAFLNSLISAGSPLISILINHKSLPLIESNDRISIVECTTSQDLELFIEVNASGREWPLDHAVYKMIRHIFLNKGNNHLYYLLYIDGRPACTAAALLFNDKYNLNFLATHKEFQRRGLMHYLNLWVAKNLRKDFYVQVNDNEPSYIYYSKLSGAEIVNTEVKYMIKSNHSTN